MHGRRTFYTMQNLLFMRKFQIRKRITYRYIPRSLSIYNIREIFWANEPYNNICPIVSKTNHIHIYLYIPQSSLSVCKEMKRFSTKESGDNDFERI